jgi:HSP20 family protein
MSDFQEASMNMEVEMADTAQKTPVKTEPVVASPQMPARASDAFGGLRAEIDRIFDDFDRFFGGTSLFRPSFDLLPMRRTLTGWGAMPSVDVVEKDDAFLIKADCPGMSEADIHLNVSGDMLTLKGERKEEKEEKKENYYLSERRFGSFQRSFQIPDTVDAEKIDASFRNGVLEIRMPKKPEAVKPERRIPIKNS